MTDHRDCYSAAEYTDLLARTKRLSDQINAVLNLCAEADRRVGSLATGAIREALEGNGPEPVANQVEREGRY